MITVKDITDKALRLYHQHLTSWVQGEKFVPLKLPVGKLPKNYVELRHKTQELLAYTKKENQRGYRLELQTRQTRDFGEQTMPVAVWVDTIEDLLALTNKNPEYQRFQEDVALIRQQLPALEPWLQQHPHRVITHHSQWTELLQVCAYWLDHPSPNLYSRELPIAVHSKFVEQNQGILNSLLKALLPAETIGIGETFEERFGLRQVEDLVRFRILDPVLRHDMGLPWSDISIPVSEFKQYGFHNSRWLIVENKMTFLTLPQLFNTIALWGKGFAIERLADTEWLNQCPIFYWGDLDAQGFQILSQLRGYFPQTRSLFMDGETLEVYQDFIVEGTTGRVVQLAKLSSQEHEVYSYLLANNLRLEQERLDQTYVNHRLLKVFDKP